MFIKIKIARIYRKNIIIYMGVEEEQLGGVMRKYRAMKAKLAGKVKKVMPKKVVTKKAAPKHLKPPTRVSMSRPKPIHRGRLMVRYGGYEEQQAAQAAQQPNNIMGGLLSMLPSAASTAPAAPTAPATPTAPANPTAGQEGGKRRRRNKSPSKAKPKAKKAAKAVGGKPIKPRRKRMLKRGGEEQEREEEMVEMQSGGFQQLEALESLVASLSGGGYGRKRVVRRRPASPRRSPSPVARRRRPVARKTH